MIKFNPKNTLDYVSEFQSKAQSIKRYIGNPYVNGDNIAEHLCRLVRLLVAITPHLKNEFPERINLIEEIFVTLNIHDDDEIIDGFDIPTAIKVHNVKDGEEVEKFKQSIFQLGGDVNNYLVPLFTSFRKKDSLAAKIAKVLDNITGNQLVIEQKIGLINPDQARFSIEYVEKVKGVSKITDLLIQSQIEQIVEYRNYATSHFDELKFIPKEVRKLLDIDVLHHPLNKTKINVPLELL